MSTTNLLPPGGGPAQQRRMSLPPPPSPLDLPEPVYGNRRPPSPLRNGFAIDPHTGEVSDASSTHPSEESKNGRQWGQRPTSPSPSVTQFAANFAQRVGSLMSNMSSKSPGLPTDEELEAEAERERERSRREAERILAKEAEERRTVEERVMAMLNSDSLRPPPPRSQTMPATPPSPSSSQKEGSWWSAAKQRLTPTKEPLTPAQQIIQETKQRDKEMEKGKKKIEKMEKRQKSKDWPTTPEGKYDDPAFIKLGQAASPSRPAASAPPSPSPLPRGTISIPPSLAPSPYRGGESDAEGASPSRAPPPLYAQFNTQGALDVPVTLLTIAKRFEKLEKWTVSHVRALEERMDDVERWLVDKEREKEASHGLNGDSGLHEIREEMAELQGRIGELGREMAKMVTAPGNLASGPSRNPPTVARAPSTSSSVAIQSISRSVTSPPRSTPPRAGTTSPPITTPVPPKSRGSRTRLPYPTGDYASPPDSSLLGQGPFSPTNSPPASVTSATKGRLSISGLPSRDEFDTFSVGNSPSGLPNNQRASGTASPVSLPPPNPPAWRPSSASPTPRKRYTVALGTPIVARDRDRSEEREQPSTPHSRSQSRELGTAFFSTSPVSTSSGLDDQSADEFDDMNEETIGKNSGRHISAGLAPPSAATSPSSSPSGGSKGRRVRPQSMYAPMTSQTISAPSPITPLNVRLRSRSTDRFGLGLSDSGTGSSIPPVTPTSGKFVDPLVIRRQTKEALGNGGPPPPKALVGKQKVPVGDLVAFFDQEKA
ncbi:hypothetical protein OH76DRAFT_1400302 [Lentinus brumalis]|uniref:Uncharacterized protein n=1 Tax=Lentinus brumalis TaxID=2498619 RepID=A0A371DJ12_9APHY|nr:hypothetical protein OH76DRAFT_1400302 [Polyporus brumalis]